MSGAGRPGRTGALLACVALALLAPAAPAAARSRAGGLDPSFAGKGWTMTKLGTTPASSGVELGSEPDGSPVVAGAFGGPIVRFEPDGSPDRSFGTEGQLRLGPAAADEGGESFSFGARSMAVDGSGRILVFGERTDPRQVYTLISGETVSSRSAVVLRFTAEGQPDPTFGEGKGFVGGDFGLGSGLETEIPMVGVLAGRADAQNRPVFVAGVTAATSGCFGHGGLGQVPRAVVRLTETGAPDPSFGGGAGVSPIQGSTASPGFGIDAKGGLAVGAGRVGGANANCEPGTTVYRLRPNGGRDAGFGTNGTRVFKRLHLALVEPSGALILSRRHGQTLGLVRIRANGSRDKGFGRDGVADVHLPIAVGLHLKPAAVDAKGRILLAGYVGSPTGERSKGQPKRSSFVVARLLSDGRLDASFGDRGYVFTHLPRGLEATDAEATLDPRGRLLLAATVTKPLHLSAALAVARYLVGG